MSIETGESVFIKANAYHVDEEYKKAAALYDEAIEIDNDIPEYYISRSINSIKLKKYTSALEDTNKALELLNENKNSKNSEKANAYFRKGNALFYLNRFGEAKSAFEEASKNGRDSDIWLRKCDAEIAVHGETKVESTSTAQVSSTPSAVVPTPSPYDPASVQPMEAEVVPPAPLTQAAKIYDKWYQTATTVCLTLYNKNTAPDQLKIIFSNSAVDASIQCADGSTYTKLFNLFSGVKASECTYKLNAFKVEINLVKDPAVDWKTLEVALQPQTKLAYPSSAKNKVEFDEVDKAVTEEEKEESKNGSQPVEHFFKQLYKDASEDTRRAMMKSYQTSGGTCLSTNWAEVEKRDYESDISAPNGQEVHTWKELNQ